MRESDRLAREAQEMEARLLALRQQMSQTRQQRQSDRRCVETTFVLSPCFVNPLSSPMLTPSASPAVACGALLVRIEAPSATTTRMSVSAQKPRVRAGVRVQRAVGLPPPSAPLDQLDAERTPRLPRPHHHHHRSVVVRRRPHQLDREIVGL